MTLPTQEAKEVRQEFADALKRHLTEVQAVLAKAEELPFQEELRGYADKLETYTRKPASEYFDLVREIDDALVEDRQEMYGPIKGFMEGPALRQYKELKAIHVAARPNRTYLAEDFFTDLDNILEHKRPYATGIMTKAEDVVKDTRQRLAEAIEKEREETRAQIQTELDNLQKLEEWEHLSKGKQGHFTDKVQRRISELKDKRTIGDIRLARPSNSATFYNNLQNDVAGALRDERKAASAAKPFVVPPSAVNHTKDGNGATPVQAAEPVDGYVPFSDLTGGRRNLKTPAEVDAFLAELRVKMLEQIAKRQGIFIR